MASTKKTSARASSVSVRRSSSAPLKPSPAICRACNNMPMRSGEILSLMLVLVFSLSAVLFTTVAAYNVEKAKVAELRAEIAVQP